MQGCDKQAGGGVAVLVAALAAFFGHFVHTAEPAASQPAPPTGATAHLLYAQMAKSLVYITARAIDKESGQEVQTQANGFLTNTDGAVLTNWHVIRKLGKNVGDIRLKVQIGSKNATERPASIVFHNQANDLLRLRVEDMIGLSDSHPPVIFLPPRDLDSMRLDQSIFQRKIFAVSFKQTVGDYHRGKGDITSLSGPSGYLWVTDMKFDDGMSGSPVFFEDGRVIGIVKGEIGSDGLFIPITVAMQTEPAIQQAEMDRLQDDMRKLRADIGGAVDTKIDAMSKAIEGLAKGLEQLQKSQKDLPQEFQKLEIVRFGDKFSLSRQAIAQAACVGLTGGPGYHTVNFAVGRRCVQSEPANCAQVCKDTLKKSVEAPPDDSKLQCLDSYYIPGDTSGGRPAADNNELGLKTVKYGSCDISGCGPNFCCCAIVRKAPATVATSSGGTPKAGAAAKGAK